MLPLVYGKHCPAVPGTDGFLSLLGQDTRPVPQWPACEQMEQEGAHIENKETREILKGIKFRKTIFSKVNGGKCINWITENELGEFGKTS